MMNVERDPLRSLAVLSVYTGILVGTLIGAGLAGYALWWQHQLVQKKLFVTALNVVCSRVVGLSAGASIALLILHPLLDYVDRHLISIRSRGVARLALMVGGSSAVAAGYWLNRSNWFPGYNSLLGIIGNVVFALICVALAFGAYKLLVGKLGPFPELGIGPLARVYRPKAFVALAAVQLALAGATLVVNRRNAPHGPNVLLITIDTLRADHLGCYGYRRNITPTIDRLAKEGVRFHSVFAQRALTWPSLTSIMTSLRPFTHGVESNEMPLQAEFLTLPEILKNAGYKTAAFLTNYFHAPNRGFDLKKGGAVGGLDRAVTDLAINWLDDQDEDRFFLWLHYKNPHAPYRPPKEFRDAELLDYDGPFDGSWATTDSIYLNRLVLNERDLSHLIALYDAEIRSTDAYIGEVLASLDAQGLTDNTLVIFSADHGEELYDHNFYFYHGCSVYDGALRIPLIFKFPRLFPQGKEIDNLFESVDILPTVLQALRIPAPQEAEGRSLLPVVFAEQPTEWHQLFAERSRKIFLTRTPRWKFIYNPDDYRSTCVRSDGDEGDGFGVDIEELYDVQQDPKETVNVVDQYPEVADSLRGQLLDWMQRKKSASVPQRITKDAEERLRALGYLQ